MNIDFSRDWPVYVLLGAVVYFFAWVIISGHRQDKDSKKESQPLDKDNKQKGAG